MPADRGGRHSHNGRKPAKGGGGGSGKGGRLPNKSTGAAARAQASAGNRRPAPSVGARSVPCTGDQRGTPATMALIAHHGGPTTPDEGPNRPQYRRQRGQATHVRGDHRRTETRRTKYLLLGATCMIPGLVLYFGGGYLFVAAYNARYPFVEITVDPALTR